MDSSKKRPSETSMEDSGSKKFNSSGGSAYHLKVLVPSGAAGAIIGKGGETIAEIQKSVGARVKMSKANDFYPGSNERVCLVTGTLDAVATIVNFIGEKIREKPEHLNSGGRGDHDSKLAAERERQMKVIVPNSTAGMIIGKGGSYIKQIKEESGSFIQLSQKSKETTLPERVITIIGDEENNRAALKLILAKVAEDPQSGSCLNISYNEFQGPVANINPTGSPFANGGRGGADVGSGCAPGPMMVGGGCAVGVNGAGGGYNLSDPRDPGGYNLSLVGGGALNMRLNFNPNLMTTDPRMMAQYVTTINTSFRAKGYNDKAADEITRAINVLSVHGVLQVELIAPSIGVGNLVEMDSGCNSSYGGSGNSTYGGGGNSAYGGGYPRPNMGRTGRTASPSSGSYNALPMNNNSFGLAMPGLHMSSQGADDSGSKVEIEVNESLVGAVIGPAGKSIVEMQHHTGANIQISKKGIYAPGTRNRIVTITGSVKSLKAAQYLVEQKVAEEENKRLLQHHQNKGY